MLGALAALTKEAARRLGVPQETGVVLVLIIPKRWEEVRVRQDTKRCCRAWAFRYVADRGVEAKASPSLNMYEMAKYIRRFVYPTPGSTWPF